MKLKGKECWLVIAVSFLTGTSCLFGCGAAEPGDDNATAGETGTAAPMADFFEPIPADDSENDAASDKGTGDWREYYSTIISAASLEQKENAENFSDMPTQYYIYDIDKDNVPELILERGTSEAGRYGQIYSWKNGKGSQVFENSENTVQNLSMSHSIFYSDPDANGVIVWQAQMGHAKIEQIYFNDSGGFSRKLLKEQTLANDQTGEDYISPSVVVTGAQELPGYKMDENIQRVLSDTKQESSEADAATKALYTDKTVSDDHAALEQYANDSFKDDQYYVILDYSDYSILVLADSVYTEQAGSSSVTCYAVGKNREVHNCGHIQTSGSASLIQENGKEIAYFDAHGELGSGGETIGGSYQTFQLDTNTRELICTEKLYGNAALERYKSEQRAGLHVIDFGNNIFQGGK